MLNLKYLGLDLGTRTCGVAISDITKTVATSLSTIHFKEKDYDELLNSLSSIFESEDISLIVLGLPKNMNNSLGFRSQETMDFGDMLYKRYHIPVVYEDERLTTIEATNYMLSADLSRKKRKKKIDSLAASIILQSYLDKEGRRK